MVLTPFQLKNTNKFEDPDAANEALQQWLDEFRPMYLASPEYQALSKANKEGGGSWFQLFMDLYLNYHGDDLKGLTLEIAEDIMLGLIPRKMVCSDSQAKTIVPELIACWQMLDRTLNTKKKRQLKHADIIIAFLDSIRQDYLDIFNGDNDSPFAEFNSLIKDVMFNGGIDENGVDKSDENDVEWVNNLIADAAENLPNFRKLPSPPQHWQMLFDQPNAAEFLDHICHGMYDHKRPNVEEAILELLNFTLQDIFMLIRQGDESTKAFWHKMEQHIIANAEDLILHPEGTDLLLTVLSVHKQFLSQPFLDFIHHWRINTLPPANEGDIAAPSSQDFEQGLRAITEQLPDEFALFAALQEQLAFLPPDGLHTIAQSLITTEKGLNCTVLMILDDHEERATSIVSALLEAPQDITPVSLARLIRIRNWLIAPVRTLVDQLIQAARKKGVSPQSPEPLPTEDIIETYMSTVDGSGAQGVILTVKADNKEQRLISFTLKENTGVLDVLVTPPAPKSHIQQYVSIAKQQDTALEKISPELIHKELPYFLDMNLKRGIAIDHDLIQAMELLGIQDWNPKNTQLSQLFAELLPTPPSDKDIEDAQRRSGNWPKSAVGVSWFVNREDIADLPLHQRFNYQIFFEKIIAPTRPQWTERTGRMALWAKYCTNKRRQKQSQDFAIVNWLLNQTDIDSYDINLLHAINRHSMD